MKFKTSVLICLMLLFPFIFFNCSKNEKENPLKPETNQPKTNTVKATIVLAKIPPSLQFNQAHVQEGDVEYEWAIYIDSDNNIATGNSGFDVSISIFHPKSSGDAPYSATILNGTEHRTWTPSWGGWLYANDIKASVDYSSNQIIMIGDREWPELSNVDESDRFYCETSYISPSGFVSDKTNTNSGANSINDPKGDVPYDFIDILKAMLEVY